MTKRQYIQKLNEVELSMFGEYMEKTKYKDSQEKVLTTLPRETEEITLEMIWSSGTCIFGFTTKNGPNGQIVSRGGYCIT